MRKIFFSIVLILFAASRLMAVYCDDLQSVINSSSSEGEMIPVLILLNDRVDTQLLYNTVKGLPKHQRRGVAVETLQKHSERSQADLMNLLKSQEINSEAKRIKPFWLTNMIALEAPKDLLEIIRERNDVFSIVYDPLRKFDNDTHREGDVESSREIAYNVEMFRAPEVWEQGFYGQGVVVGVVDTGTNYNHHDIRNSMWQNPDYPYYGYNFFHDNYDTMDEHSHGTHCAGTIAGDGTSGSQTGVAPASQIMTLRISDHSGGSTMAIFTSAFEFAVEEGADVLSVSYYMNNASTAERIIWREIVENLLSVGIPMSGAAGNRGEQLNQYPIPRNIPTPMDCPPPWLHPDQTVQGGLSAVIAVGAIDSNNQIASFSSKGPVTWQDIEIYNDYPYNPGIGLIRPDIVAPGVNIKSLHHQNITGYTNMSGTSMATPGVAGVIALMLSKDNNLTPESISQILEETAHPFSATKSNTFGSGRVDAFEAVSRISDEIPPNAVFRPYPSNGQINSELALSFSWLDGGHSTSFKFNLGTDNPPTNIYHNVELFETSFTPEEALEPSTDYYWQIVSSNSFGVTDGPIWSFSTGLTVSEDFESGDFSKYEWQFAASGTGAENWSITENEAYRGQYSARSGNIGHNSSTRISVRLEILEEGVISFHRKVSSEPNYDLLRFYIDNDIMGEWSGEKDWEKVTFPVSPGFRNFRWEYRKDPLTTVGQDRAWIDEIIFPLHPAPPVIYVPHSVNVFADYQQIHLGWDIELNEDLNPNIFTLLGFDLYKSSAPDSEFAKVNEEIMGDSAYSEFFTASGDYYFYIKAIYRKMGQLVESERSETVAVTIFPAPNPPQFDPPEGEYFAEVTVELTSDDAETTIYYTIDGNEPNLDSELYTEPFVIDQTTTVRARTFKAAHLVGEISEAEYQITLTSIEENEFLPEAMSLRVYPNPMTKRGSYNRSVDGINIEYYLPLSSERVELNVYNVKGQVVRNIRDVPIKAGKHSVIWDLSNERGGLVGNGIYFVHLTSEKSQLITKVMIIR